MINYIEKTPTADEFNLLTNSVGWGSSDMSIIEKALKNTVYAICVYDDNNIVGFGRLIGDMAMFLYIQDVMVLPEYQGKQIGTNIMKYLLSKVEKFKNDNPDIRTYLGASKGKDSFYKRFDFVTREEANLGAGMILF